MYSHEADEQTEIVTVPKGELFTVSSVTDVYGNVVDDDDYTVLYFQKGDDDIYRLVSASNANDGTVGGVPTEVGDYKVAVIYGEDPYAGQHGEDGSQYNQWAANYEAKCVAQTQDFTVKEVATLEGAYAYEVNDTDANDTSDKAFKYNGAELNIEVAAADGTPLKEGKDYSIVWTENASEASTSGTVENAGDYTAKIYGAIDSKYAGTEAPIEFTVDPINLDEDTLSFDMVDSKTGMNFSGSNAGRVVLKTNELKVNGEAYKGSNGNDILVTAISCAAYDGNVYSDQANWKGQNTTPGKWEINVADNKTSGENNGNIIGSAQTVNAYVVSQLITFNYDDQPLVETSQDANDGYFPKTFLNSKGEAFNEKLIEVATDDRENVDFDLTVTKDGVEATSYTEPGEYVGTIDVPVAAKYAYGAHVTFKFNVAAKEIGDVTVFAAVDGKAMADSAVYPYTGSAYVPAIVVKDGKTTLTAGEDYTVAYEQDGKAVESMTEVGDYKIVISFPGAVNKSDGKAKADYKIDFTIEKATIASVKADADYFALPADGSAAAPTFTGYTKDGYKGQAFELSAAEIAVKYYAAKAVTGEGGIVTGWTKADDAEALDAEDLTKAGRYVADVTVLNTAKSLKGGDENVVVVVTDKVSFDDVDANAWYADEVYQAAKNHYVQGMGNKLFFPEAQMTRAQFAQVLYNMAGETGEWGTHPTQFTDVTADAWYAEAVSWAVEAGVVKGTSETTFDPEGSITREQIATMLYRYAGNGAQADLSVLDEFVDGGEVCDWAETAVAWAVESGYMNGKGANDLQPHANATRAEVAALAVRVQPEPIEKPII